MTPALRLAVIAVAAASVYPMTAEGANAASDALLAATGGFVAWRFLDGYRKEALARKPANANRKSDLQEEARNIYARISLQHPRLLGIAMFGCALKVSAVLAMIPLVHRSLWGA